MPTAKGPGAVEYNCDAGGPETQVVLPLLKTDLLTIMRAVHDGTLESVPVEFANGAAACVVIASGGYPKSYPKGLEIDLGKAEQMPDVTVCHAGTALKGATLVASRGRVLGVSAVGDDLPAALE